MEKKQKKIIGIIIAVIVVVLGGFTTISSMKNKEKQALNPNQQKQQIPKKISVRYAFADIDFDQIIQDVDTKDDDPKADYLFIRFTGKIVPSKVKNSIFDIKNYKFDGKEIPKNSEVLLDKNSGDTTLIIKLPNGLLKGKNAGHELEINKNVNINDITKIDGELKLKLPYSTKTTLNLEKSDDKNSKENNSKSNLSNNKNVVSKDKDIKDKNKVSGEVTSNNNKEQTNENTPKYSMEVGKGIPFTTIVLVRLDVKDPSKYVIQIGDEKLDMKKNKKGELVFIKAIKKDYSYADVEDRLKIEKIK